MATNKEYWDAREVPEVDSWIRSVGRRLKSNSAGLKLLSFFLPSRVADEHFLRNVLKRYHPRVLLDVACGAGKPVLPANVPIVYGVDVKGFPAHLAEKIGYRKAIAYEPEEYDFNLETPVDMITCINLNAHIPFDSFRKILTKALRYLEGGCVLVILAELDNSGISYSRFRDGAKKQALVNGMEHYYFESRDAFFGKMIAAFPELDLIEERSLGPIVSLSQHYVYHTSREPGVIAKRLILIGDLITGPISSIYAKFRPRCESFLVAFVFKKGQ
jgi:hypothetical protein